MFATLSLTEEQRRAVEHTGGHLLVVAGAGTGKITTLAARVAHLVGRGVAPERILLLTFSRRAAAELLRRAEHCAGQAVASAAWGGTFHAVANRLLRRHGRALGLDPSFTVLDASDSADLMALVRSELDGLGSGPGHDGGRSRRARKETLAAILSRCVNTSTPLSEVLRTAFPWCSGERLAIRATLEAYTARKRRARVLDYDDLLLCWAALLRQPGPAAALRAQFDHVLVDEYQDTNALQADVLAGMAGIPGGGGGGGDEGDGAGGGGAVLTAVGDDAQAIYGFRSATQRNILDFPARFGADVVLLERNHRSTPQILATTNAVIAEARRRHPKTLWSQRGDGPTPSLVSCADEGAQSAAVCRRILGEHERGVALRDQAVLFRTGHHSDLLELELGARNIPFAKYGGLRFLEAAHVKDLLCLLRLVENPRDELAWFRVLQLLDGVGPATARVLAAAAAAATAGTGTGAGADIGEIGALPAVARLAAGHLLAALAQARQPPSAGRPGVAVERARTWLDPVVEARYPSPSARLADLDELERAAAAAPSLSRFLVELTLDPPASTGDLAGPPHLDDDVLTLSTIHSAKGGEWDVVHVLHLADGNVPSDLATGDAEAVEEERRLLYVAFTRARNRLQAYVPLRYHHRRRGHDDAHGYAQMSRFLTPAVVATMRREGEPTAGHDSVAEVDTGAVSPGDTELHHVDALVAGLLD